MKITITVEGNQFMGKRQETQGRTVSKISKEFYVKVVDAQVTFDKNEKTLTVYQNGQAMKGKKID